MRIRQSARVLCVDPSSGHYPMENSEWLIFDVENNGVPRSPHDGRFGPENDLQELIYPAFPR